MKTEIQAPHGRETYIADFGDGLVMKRPLPEFTQAKKDKWLQKQIRTKVVVDDISSVGNPVYNIPKMLYIKDSEYQLLEERAPGVDLTVDLYQGLTTRQRYEIITSLAHFLVDMNESKEVSGDVVHNLSQEIKVQRLHNIMDKKLPRWFSFDEVRYIEKILEKVGNFQYVTRKAWSHCDLNCNNVLYDPQTSKISFIDFAEADYNFIFHDIFSPLAIDLDICKPLYEEYTKLHNKDLYRIYGPRNPELQNIMAYRTATVFLKRITKCGDDLRLNSQSEKTQKNNVEKVYRIHDLIGGLQRVEKQMLR